jgi:hypothetical protein
MNKFQPRSSVAQLQSKYIFEQEQDPIAIGPQFTEQADAIAVGQP